MKMKVYDIKPSGYCKGVVDAINKAKEVNISFNGYNIKVINLLGMFNHKEHFNMTDPLKYFDEPAFEVIK